MGLLYEIINEIKILQNGSLEFPLHLNHTVEAVIILEGECTAICEQTHIRMEPGDLFVSFPNQIHGFEDIMVTKMYQATIPVATLLHHFQKKLTETVPVSHVIKKGFWEQSGLLELFRAATQDPLRCTAPVRQGYALLIVAKLLSVVELKEVKAGPAEALRSILVYVNENYTQPITRMDVAKAVGYNESYVSHLFSETLKMSLFDYIHSLRVARAEQLLLQTDMTVTRIATELGFGSIRNFNRVFLKIAGMSPKEYRHNRRDKGE